MAMLRAEVDEFRAERSSWAPQEALRHGSADAVGDDGAQVRKLEFENARLRAAAETNGSTSGAKADAGGKTESEWSDDGATPATFGILLEQHPRNRFAVSDRKHKITGDQARLLKVLKADSTALQTVGHLREVCRRLENVGHAIDDTTTAFAAGECGAEALVSLLHQLYTALAAPSEEFEAGETRATPSMLIATEERMDLLCMARDTSKIWSIALQQDDGEAKFSAPAVRSIKAAAALKELQRVEKSLLKGGRAPKKTRPAKSDSDTDDGESSDEAPAVPAPPVKVPRTSAQKTADHLAAAKRRAAAGKAKAP